MASVPEDKERSQTSSPDAKGTPTFAWQTTNSLLGDTVKLTMPPSQVLPIIFVPGIMGSNLCTTEGDEVWVLNATWGAPLGLAWMWAKRGAGTRQKLLHPKRTRVFNDGDVPSKGVGTIRDEADFKARGWGEVSEASYHAFLLWLEQKMNSEGFNPAKWEDFFYESISATPEPGAPAPVPKLAPGITMKMSGLPMAAEDEHRTEPIVSDDLLKRAKYRFPVYACGYNWLASNSEAADLLKQRIADVIAENNKGPSKCEQVILVTHSMGGLVARACARLDGMADSIAGIVHGVMPAIGAAVAYRRCKVGMREESFGAGLVIGSNGREVTAVFAQAPGALQLLPSVEYGPNWLHISNEKGEKKSLPAGDPYEEIYLEKGAWWGLVREEWLSPKDGVVIKWNEFAKNVKLAKSFHAALAGSYHAQTYVFYGAWVGKADKSDSFQGIHWKMKRGMTPADGSAPGLDDALTVGHDKVRTDGSNKLYLGGQTEYQPDYSGFSGGHVYETSFWEISCDMQDGNGDGTVPASSGKAPRQAGKVKQQFKLDGFEHEPAYANPTAQRVTHYSITKIAAIAKQL